MSRKLPGSLVVACQNHPIKRLGVTPADGSLVDHLIRFTQQHNQVGEIVDFGHFRSSAHRSQVTNLTVPAIKIAKNQCSLAQFAELDKLFRVVVGNEHVNLAVGFAGVPVAVALESLSQSAAEETNFGESLAGFANLGKVLGVECGLSSVDGGDGHGCFC